MQSAPSLSQDPTHEEIQVSPQRKAHCQVELHVKTSKELVKKARKEAIREVNKEISLPGFRKGKAPEEIILKKFGNEVERRVPKAIADAAFVNARKIANIPVLNNNAPITFDLKSVSEEGAELVFVFETEPTIPSPDAKTFTPVAVDRPEVGEKQIEEAIRQMRFFYAEWTPVIDRGVQEGDFIMINLDTIEGDVVNQVFHHIRFEVAPERMANWMKNLVFGAKAGDVLEGISEPDETASDAEKQEFQPKKVRLHLLKVEEAALPPLDDEFAKKVGAPDVAGMRESIAQILNQKAEEKVQQGLREQVNDFLVATYAFDLPRSLIETEKKHRHEQLMKDPKFRTNWETLDAEGKTKIEESLTQEATQAVRLFYLSRQIVHDQKLPITHKEVQDEAVASLHEYGVRQVDVAKISKEVFALALSKVILKKAQDFIIQAQKA